MTLTIKNIPDSLVARLRARAARNHRSLQSELMAIVEQAVRESEVCGWDQLVAQGKALGLADLAGQMPRSVDIVREARDSRHGG